ncbi:MAG: hypothetical protein LBE65_03630 [Synergistaceae bacterium]|jgi:hypothetical protein|nr:hypothetical protein [Synergistaceae bacterium]
MKKIFVRALFMSLMPILVLRAAAAAAFEKWDVQKEVTRLSAAAPYFAAYPSATGAIFWKLSDRYSVADDGSALHEGIHILFLKGGASGKTTRPVRFPYPDEDGASFEVTLSAWYDPDDGRYLGELVREEYDLYGIRGVEISFPMESAGRVAVIAFSDRVPGDRHLDGVVPLTAVYPVWERTVEVEAPNGAPVYWEGVGVREPERARDGEIERYIWTVLNEPAWEQSRTGLIDIEKPALAFSLDHGQFANLKKLRELENAPYAPKMPSSVAARSGPKKTLRNIAEYMSSRLIMPAEGTDRVRKLDVIGPDGPWTGWEQVLIAAWWMRSLGFKADVYWIQKIPSGKDGPASRTIWSEPVLRVRDKNMTYLYFKSGQAGSPEKIHPDLYGKALYKAGNNEAERITVPRGTASNHVLRQNWEVSVDESGIASGRVDMTFTGAWTDIFSFAAADTGVMPGMNFSIQGITFEERSSKNIPNGRRVSYTVRAAPGIAAQGSLLLKLMGGLPVCFGEIPKDGSAYSFRFPFIFEINGAIVTPKGYSVLSMPEKNSIEDSGAAVEQSAAHWPRKRLLESSCRWTVRSVKRDRYRSAGIAEQLAAVSAWPDTVIPLRKLTRR